MASELNGYWINFLFDWLIVTDWLHDLITLVGHQLGFMMLEKETVKKGDFPLLSLYIPFSPSSSPNTLLTRSSSRPVNPTPTCNFFQAANSGRRGHGQVKKGSMCGWFVKVYNWRGVAGGLRRTQVCH